MISANTIFLTMTGALGDDGYLFGSVGQAAIPINCSSSNSSIITVTPDGFINCVGDGTCTLYYEWTNTFELEPGFYVAGGAPGYSFTATVTGSVSSAIEGPTQVLVGHPVQYTESNSGGTWSSSNPAVITINASTGLATPVALGSATITVTLGANWTETLDVTVVAHLSTPAGGTIGLPFIKSLFSSILAYDQIILGNFHICPKQMSELNNPNIEELIAYLPTANIKKYPCVLMPVPHISGNFQYSGLDENSINSYDSYSITLAFLTPAYYSQYNQISGPGVTGKTTHTITDTIHDMYRCAKDFVAVLNAVIFNAGLQGTIIIDESVSQGIEPVADIGNDKVSGVLLRMPIKIFRGCTIECYPSNYLELITVPPVTDAHPFHTDI